MVKTCNLELLVSWVWLLFLVPCLFSWLSQDHYLFSIMTLKDVESSNWSFYSSPHWNNKWPNFYVYSCEYLHFPAIIGKREWSNMSVWNYTVTTEKRILSINSLKLISIKALERHISSVRHQSKKLQNMMWLGFILYLGHYLDTDWFLITNLQGNICSTILSFK